MAVPWSRNPALASSDDDDDKDDDPEQRGRSA